MHERYDEDRSPDAKSAFYGYGIVCKPFIVSPGHTTISAAARRRNFLIQFVAVKLVWFCPAGKMQPICLPSIYEPVGRGDESVVFTMWLFVLIPVHRLKCTDSVIVPVAPDDLSIGSTNSGANNYFMPSGA
jgi:hypothetical protein